MMNPAMNGDCTLRFHQDFAPYFQWILFEVLNVTAPLNRPDNSSLLCSLLLQDSGDPGFPVGGANLFFGKTFAENCMKIKEARPRTARP